MESKATATRTPIGIVKFNGAKTVIAVAMTDRQIALQEAGEELGYATADSELAWTAALKQIKTPADRAILKSGFVSAYKAARNVGDKTAIQAFDRRAAQHAPHTSRKAKSNATKAKSGRKEKTGGKGEHVPAQDVALRLAAVLHYVAKAQAKHAGDDEVLEMLGEIAAIAGGKTK